jgi:hypothetical protein
MRNVYESDGYHGLYMYIAAAGKWIYFFVFCTAFVKVAQCQLSNWRRVELD